MMNGLARLFLGGTLTALIGWGSGCSRAPGAPSPHLEISRPDQQLDFTALYSANCAGCHGTQGRNGAALALNNPAYLAVAGPLNLRSAIARGLPTTLMPAFARSSGGMLTDQQVDALVVGMLRQWSRPDQFAGVALPPYSPAAPGNSEHGQLSYQAACARCHGADGNGVHPASGEPEPSGGSRNPIVDPSYLALVGDQSLRTIVIAGHPGDQPIDWRTYVNGRALTSQEISDIVAWLGTHRVPANQQSILNSRDASSGGNAAEGAGAHKEQP